MTTGRITDPDRGRIASDPLPPEWMSVLRTLVGRHVLDAALLVLTVAFCIAMTEAGLFLIDRR